MALPKVYRHADDSVVDRKTRENNGESAIVPAVPTGRGFPGAFPLKTGLHERYARYRAEGLTRVDAFREASRRAFRGRHKQTTDKQVSESASRLERNQKIAERIQYLSQDVSGLLQNKRQRLEERLWSIHESAIGDYLETIEIDGKTIERPKRISELPREVQQNIEKIAITASGRLVPQLYSKLQASQELRRMLNIGRGDDSVGIARLSDAELVAQLSEQANQLGVKIDLSYSFDGDQAGGLGVSETDGDDE